MNPQEQISTPVARALFIAAALVLGLRLAVGWDHLESLGDAAAEGAGLKLALGVMGLGYLACGTLALHRVRSAASGLFALHCLGQAVHWGGPPRVDAGHLQLAIWLVYFILSMLGISAILHFTLLFPSRLEMAGRRVTRLFLYLPIALATVLAAARLAVTGPRGEVLQTAFLALEAIQVNLYGLLAFVVIAVRWTRASRPERRATGLGVMLAGVLLGELPYLVASLLPGLVPVGPDPLPLFFILGPIAIVYAILKVGAPARA